MQPHPDYSAITSGQDGDYQQLNDSLLQIENEFYSPIRPKRVAHSGETPLNALVPGGIEYIEVRCVDVSPFSPVGLDDEQIRFMDTFLLYCLLQESPPCDEAEQAMQAANLEGGGQSRPGAGPALETTGRRHAHGRTGHGLLEQCGRGALLDAGPRPAITATSWRQQDQRSPTRRLTPSARILREMREQDLPFFRLAMSYSERWGDYFRNRALARTYRPLSSRKPTITAAPARDRGR